MYSNSFLAACGMNTGSVFYYTTPHGVLIVNHTAPTFADSGAEVLFSVLVTWLETR